MKRRTLIEFYLFLHVFSGLRYELDGRGSDPGRGRDFSFRRHV